ncbi:universal stress protein [Halopiger goleimassiliensis]|uniref:universal stress protein n=1 Tax=Halopiger goleimassiliensis TaxID=1293048 RepID=UPI00067800F3|nr:universal stress protein [Halopiger goleimassiliensis]
MSRELLVPMDDSATARAALEHALSAFPDADVTVVHVVDDLEAGYGGTPTADDAAEIDIFEDASAIAAEVDRTVETELLGGTAADAILEYAHAEGVDGIVMGSEGRSGVSRMLLGSVAEAVTRRSSVPVTIVPAPE